MPELKNSKHEAFAQNTLIYETRKEAYMEAGYHCAPKYAAQNAWNLCNNNPEIVARIEELEKIARSNDGKEVNDYIKLFEDIAFARGDFKGEKKAKVDQRISAAIKAMKAQGIEGAENININGNCGFQLIMHDAPQEEEEGDKNGEENKGS